MHKSTIILFLCLLNITLFSQGMDFLPKNNIWETQTLDPLACQSYGMASIYFENGSQADFYLTSFAFGFQRSIFAWPKSENRSFDFGIEGAAITQFEWTERTGEFQRNNLSTDFLIGLPITWKIDKWSIRFRVYHLSAHMGDDYMIRNGITSYVRNNNNYEQFDISTLFHLNRFVFSAGAGTILRASQPRKPLVFNVGAQYRRPLNKAETLNLFLGFYSDTRQDNDYRLSVNLGAGIQFGKTENHPFKILLSYFNGPLPYSIYQGRSVYWYGIGFYINLF